MKVKFLARTAADQDPALWTALLPGGDPASFGVSWTFDPDARDYDYLVVYEDLPYPPGSARSTRVERLSCARANTLFVTTEPTSIKVYGRHYLRQFGRVLSRQPADAIDHPGHIQRTPPLRPYYGRPLGRGGHYLTVDELAAHHPGKSRDVSAVCSNKTMTSALKARYDFVIAMRERAGLEVFGRGIQPIDEKSEAMDPFRCHVAIENHIAPGHWTEKISDCFLAECVPLYHGDPDIGAVFPEEAILPLDIYDLEASAELIARAPAEYGRLRPAVLEGKRRVLEDLNLLRVCADIARKSHQPGRAGGDILGRHAFRRAHPVRAAQDALHAAQHKT